MLKRTFVLPYFMVLVFFMVIGISFYPAFGEPTSAEMNYSVIQNNSIYTYTVDITNTSQDGYYIYTLLFGGQYDVPLDIVGPLENIVVLTIPEGWYTCYPAAVTYNFVICEGPQIWDTFPVPYTIAPGESTQLVFTSTSPPPDSLVFGVGFLDSEFTAGFAYNGVAFLTNPILDPVDEINELQTFLHSMNLQKGLDSNLDKKLEAAKNSLENGNPDKAAKYLNSFIKMLEIQSGKKIDDSQATQLINSALTILDHI